MPPWILACILLLCGCPRQAQTKPACQHLPIIPEQTINVPSQPPKTPKTRSIHDEHTTQSPPTASPPSAKDVKEAFFEQKQEVADRMAMHEKAGAILQDQLHRIDDAFKRSQLQLDQLDNKLAKVQAAEAVLQDGLAKDAAGIKHQQQRLWDGQEQVADARRQRDALLQDAQDKDADLKSLRAREQALRQDQGHAKDAADIKADQLGKLKVDAAQLAATLQKDVSDMASLADQEATALDHLQSKRANDQAHIFVG